MIGRKVPGNKFSVVVSGNTNGTHGRLVSLIKTANYFEVPSPQESDFLLVFCPVVSRVGTDIGEALQNMDRNKKKVLVVMHHTFNPNTVIAESRRQVEDPNVLLTVDFFFYENKLLNCDWNNTAWDQVCRFLVIPPPQASCMKSLINCSYRKFWLAIAVVFATAMIFCWSQYGINLWIAFIVVSLGVVIIIVCRNKFGVNNNSAFAVAVVFSGAMIIFQCAVSQLSA